MPVTTRSKRQRQSDLPAPLQHAQSHPTSKPSVKSARRSTRTAKSRNPIQLSVASGPRSIPRPPRKSRKRPQRATERASPDLPTDAVTHLGCWYCACSEGAFQYPVDACIRCEHEMDDHDQLNTDWNHNCDFVCERPELVASIIKLLRGFRVVIIRATPLVGKSTLLNLLGLHILNHEKDLEPIFVYWQTRAKRDNLPYEEYLKNERLSYQKRNAPYHNSEARRRPVYLIDEAQDSYEEDVFWARDLKGHNIRNSPMFVLICLYGAAGVSPTRESNMESQALQIDSLQRVELRPSAPGRLYILFKPEETKTVILKWAIANKYKFEDGLPEYLHAATDGHPGMVGGILQYFQFYFPQLPDPVRHSRTWPLALCHEMIVEHEGLVTWFAQHGRGVWTTKLEGFVEGCLQRPIFQHIALWDVKKVLREVATRPHGCTRSPEQDNELFGFCHRMGMLHTEQARPGSKDVTYIFASPIHRRVAFRRLCPGPDLGTRASGLSLQQACLNAVERFSPSALRTRSERSPDDWNVPEAAFQDEMYCCLSYELHNLPILSEYSHTQDGRVDFYLYDKKWCVEVLQCGSQKAISDHTARFARGGKYEAWNISEDYIILNFCSRQSFHGIEIEDVEVRPHFLQIVVDPEASLAEAYRYDGRLLAAVSLAEGRRRHDGKPPNNAESLNFIQRQQAKRKREEQEEQEMERQTKRQMQQAMKRQMEQEMNRQLEQRERQMNQQLNRQLEQREREMNQQMEQRERGMKRQIEQEVKRQVEQREEEMKRRVTSTQRRLDS